MYCTQCGKKLPEDAKFCGSCGTPINAEVPEAKSKSESSEPARKTESRISSEVGGQVEKHDRKAPPKVSVLTIFLAIIGLILILVLLHPWHADQKAPPEFRNNTEQSGGMIIPGDGFHSIFF